MRFVELVDINPSVQLKRGQEYCCIMMDQITPGQRYVYNGKKRIFNGGSTFSSGDILFARITPCLENGKIAQFINENNESGFGSTEYFVFRNRKGISNLSFIYYLCLSDFIRKPAEKSMFGASGRQRADLDVVKHITIPHFPLTVQNRIAAILSAYDDLIDKNLRCIKLLEEVARMVYNEWFVKFQFPGHERAKMVNSKMGRIPKGWSIAKIGDIAEQVREGVDPQNILPETPYFGLEHFPRRSITLNQWGKASDVQSTKLVFNKGATLFGKIRPYFHKVGVAPVDGVCSSDTIVIHPKKPDFFSLVLSCVSSDDFIALATKTSQGTKMPRANWEVLCEKMLPIPKEPLQSEFNKTIVSIVNYLQNLLFKNRNLQITRDFLLPRLLSGEIDVSHLDIDTSNLDKLSEKVAT